MVVCRVHQDIQLVDAAIGGCPGITELPNMIVRLADDGPMNGDVTTRPIREFRGGAHILIPIGVGVCWSLRALPDMPKWGRSVRLSAQVR